MQSVELLTLSEQSQRIIPTSPQLNPQYAAGSERPLRPEISNRVSVSSGTGAPPNLSIWRKSRDESSASGQWVLDALHTHEAQQPGSIIVQVGRLPHTVILVGQELLTGSLGQRELELK